MQDTFLLGDSAYPNLRWLIPPYKDNGVLSHNQKQFNYRHSSVRIIVEHAFGLLKCRFRRLRAFENRNVSFISKCVVAACVLHNICINFDDLQISIEHIDNTENPETEHFCPSVETFNEEDRREQIFNRMCQ